MKIPVKSVIVIFINCCIISSLNAQTVITPAGNHFSSPSVSLSWTLGEPVIESFTGTEAILNQGFLQTGLKVTPIKDSSGLELHIRAYPNPASEILYLEMEEYENLSWYLYDANGKLILMKKIESRITEIPVVDLNSATYLLKIKRRNNELKAFRIVIN